MQENQQYNTQQQASAAPSPDQQSQSLSKDQIDQIENSIEQIKTQIKDHRQYNSSQLQSTEFCWYFGIKNLVCDYGDVWDTPSYWKILIEGNKRLCTSEMFFTLNTNPCDNCRKSISDLNLLQQQWNANSILNINLQYGEQ